MYVPVAKEWHIDVDKYINPHTPRNPIRLLPRPLAHFLGHRDRPRREVGNIIVAAWALLGAFAGIAIVAASFMIPEIKSHAPPVVIASFVRLTSRYVEVCTNNAQGAAAILEYNTIESPLAQPRNSILGHFLSTTIGVAITKLFKLSSSFENLRWLAGGLSCGSASALMTLTQTIYPPAGATALLASVDPQVEALGWYLIPLVLLSSALTLLMSLLLNNIQRCYPTYWWTPVDLQKKSEGEDIEKLPSKATKQPSSDTSSQTFADHPEEPNELIIKINSEKVVVPEGFYLAAEEERMLEVLRDRLREGLPRPH